MQQHKTNKQQQQKNPKQYLRHFSRPFGKHPDTFVSCFRFLKNKLPLYVF